MKVFGIGLEKTGTNTLGKALEILGFGPQSNFDIDLLRAYKLGQWDLVDRASELHDQFAHYPWAFVYERMADKYPDAKFILTKRTSSRRWHRSLCHHAQRGGPEEYRQLVYGHAMPQLFEYEDIGFYDRHVQQVSEYFSLAGKDRLIQVCWAHEDGWTELCEFLEKPIPDQEFPHLNR